ncbi:chemotaxis protein CheW [Piscinibacter sp. Jin2]|uniref:Chemotaxis protein CheW n=1 Tax=Aquariibacter lacus TaxID=2801332 RepID=A0A9X0XEY0_9BURK|nr:chemotaxis protein CheW [Piscinibacter lacus]MBL0720459.1 chemotaxis protein CheW [Piscinibacter lacus]
MDTLTAPRTNAPTPAAAAAPARTPSRNESSYGAAHGQTANAPGREYLSFCLGQEEYGIDILKVQEIRSYEAPTRIANAPSFLKGVINLRGVIVPVIDLRVKFGCEAEITAITAVVVLSVKGRIVGAVVDSVSDVLELPHALVKPAPEMGTLVDTSHLMGIANVNERMLILLDIESLMSSSELGLIDAASH